MKISQHSSTTLSILEHGTQAGPEQDGHPPQVQPEEAGPDAPPRMHIPPAAWLLAQVSVASTHRALAQSKTMLWHQGQRLRTEGGEPVWVGPGRDGNITQKTGFLPGGGSSPTLPQEFSAFEQACADLPTLLKWEQARDAVLSLPSANFANLEDKYLSRAALVLSSLAHAFYFNRRVAGKIDNTPLPEHLTTSWRTVCERLQRTVPGVRVAADDIFNNVAATRPPTALGSLPLSLEYFRLPEERLSSGLQGRVELGFAPCLEDMCQAQRAIAMHDDGALIDLLSSISAHLVACGKIMDMMSPCVFDAAIWGRTYPIMGAPIVDGELGNSGVDAPMFHALDAFLGRERGSRGDLQSQQDKRAKAFPATVQALIKALADPAYSLRSYVESSENGACAHAFHVVMQTYAWLLERHRCKAVGAIGVVLAGGRPATAGGANQTQASRHMAMPVDEMLNRQMVAASADRMRGIPTTLQACLESAPMVGARALRLTLGFTTPVPLRAGDRVYITPKVQDADLGAVGTASLDRAEGMEPAPRAYSVGDIEPAGAGLAKRINLTVALPSLENQGLSVTYLRSLRMGDEITLRISPSPLLHLPENVAAPIILIGQGVGIGPLFGFLQERSRTLDADKSPFGLMHVIAVAQRMIDIPYIDEMIALTQKLPLTLTLALTQDRGKSITGGMVRHFPTSLRLEDAIKFESGPLMHAMLLGAHTYVCGSVPFGMSTRESVSSLLRGHGESPGARLALTRNYHEDLFSGGNFSEEPFRHITAQELASHNTPDSLWSSFGGYVFDLTRYAQQHPGGAKVLMEVAGLQGDRRLRQIHGGDAMREVVSRMAPYKLGALEKWPLADEGGLSQILHDTLQEVVKAQNIFRNNTMFSHREENVPFFVVADAALVTAERDLPKILDHFPAVNAEDLVPKLKDFRALAQDYLRTHGPAGKARVMPLQRVVIDSTLAVLERIKVSAARMLDKMAYSAVENSPALLLTLSQEINLALGSLTIAVEESLQGLSTQAT